MLELGVIEPSRSEWNNPIVLVIKKVGSIRLCIDLRKVNAQSVFDAYPLPRLEDFIERVGHTKFITTLDLCKGYWQVPLNEGTAFRTPQGLWQFTKMAFGLHGVPATFQRLNQLLAGMDTFAAAYLDDIVIYSTSWHEHLSHLTTVLGKPMMDKVEVIQTRERPTTQKQVKSFLGLVGLYRHFIQDFSSRAAPLSDLTSMAKDKFVWGEEQEKAFQDLKVVFCWEPVLQSPNLNLPLRQMLHALG